MRTSFTIEGDIQPKERPRMRQYNGHITTYTPSKTKRYEQKVKDAYWGIKYDPDIPLRVSIAAYLSIPKSASKKQKELMRSGAIRPLKTPDNDNIAKSICDALNGVAYADDKQVVRLVVEKWYSDNPRAEVTVEEVKY